MRFSYIVSLLSVGAPASSSPVAVPAPEHPVEKRSNLPLNVAAAQFLGNVSSRNSHAVRDLGFQGRLGSFILLSFGDTMYRDAAYTADFHGMTSNSVGLATASPLKFDDPKLNAAGWPEQFCPLQQEWGEDKATHALGITNVVETMPGQGILFFLKNYRPTGVDNLVGAGVAVVRMQGSVPFVTRLAEYWWNAQNEPRYGDIGVLRHKDYIYAYGHGPGDNFNQAYVTRVLATQAPILSAYEYWNGLGWQKNRLRNVGERESVSWGVNQGQVFWSPYFECFMFVYCDNWMDQKILAKVSYSPVGPWSNPVTLYKANKLRPDSMIYAAVPHPYFDDSGKTLVIWYTNSPNCIQAIKVTFK